jgi:hypothetical protein
MFNFVSLSMFEEIAEIEKWEILRDFWMMD